MRHIFWIAPLLAGLLLAWAVALAPASQRPPMPTYSQPEVDPDLRGLSEKLESRASAVLSGRLIDTSNRPVAEAIVAARTDIVVAWTRSDAEGRFSLQGLLPGKAKVSAWRLGSPPIGRELDVPQADIEVVLPEFEFAAGEPSPTLDESPLAGRVLGCIADSSELSGAPFEVLLVPRDPVDTLQSALLSSSATDAQGRFEFPHLLHGTYRVVVLPAWARGGSWPDLTAASSRELEHGPNSPPHLTIELACGSILAQLLDEEGVPVEGALVTMAPTDQPARVWPPTTTGPDGRFEFNALPSGDYQLDVRAGEGSISALRVRVEAGGTSTLDLPPILVRKR